MERQSNTLVPARLSPFRARRRGSGPKTPTRIAENGLRAPDEPTKVTTYPLNFWTRVDCHSVGLPLGIGSKKHTRIAENGLRAPDGPKWTDNLTP